MPETGLLSEYLNELTDEPDDQFLFDLSVETSPSVWVSMMMEYQHIKRLPPAFTQDVVLVGSGTGIEESSLMVGDLGFATDHYEGASNFFDATNYARYIDDTPITGGSVFHNAKDIMSFTVDNGSTLIRMENAFIDLISGLNSFVLRIGNSISSPTGAKVQIHGETDDDTKSALDITRNDAPESLSFRFRNDGRLGIGIASPSALLDIVGSTVDRASLHIGDGNAPAVPVNGDQWTEGGVPKVRTGGITKDVGSDPSLSRLDTEFIHDVSTVDSDGGAGISKINNADYTLATFLFMNDFDNNEFPASVVFERLRFGDLVYQKQLSDTNKSVVFRVTGDPIDGGGYWKIPVEHIASGSGGNLLDTELIGIVFFFTGKEARTIASGDTSVLNATDTLLATFTPLDNKAYKLLPTRFKASDPPIIPIEWGQYETSTTSVGFGAYQLKQLVNGDLEARVAFSEGAMGVAHDVIWTVKEEDL